MKTSLFNQITRALATASQIIIAAPVRLPPKVVAVAKYVSLGAALLEAIGHRRDAMPLVSSHEEAGGRVPVDGDAKSCVSTNCGGVGKEEPDDGH